MQQVVGGKLVDGHGHGRGDDADADAVLNRIREEGWELTRPIRGETSQPSAPPPAKQQRSARTAPQKLTPQAATAD